MNNESVITFILFISILSRFCGWWVSQSFKLDEMYSTSVSLKSRACVSVCVRARKFEISPIQIKFKSKVGYRNQCPEKEWKKKFHLCAWSFTLMRSKHHRARLHADLWCYLLSVKFMSWCIWTPCVSNRQYVFWVCSFKTVLFGLFVNTAALLLGTWIRT